MRKSYNRMEKNTKDRTPIPVEPVQIYPIPMVIPCPDCGCCRHDVWETCSGGKGDPYKRCRGCGRKYRHTDNGLILIG